MSCIDPEIRPRSLHGPYAHAVMALACALGFVWGCDAPPKPTPKVKKTQPKAKKTPAPRPVRPANLNSALNLKPSGERHLGFALPMGVRKTERERSRYLITTSRRLLRFYGSRKHLVRKRLNGWEISHTALSLEGVKEGDKYRRAKIFIAIGPGPGYTLRFAPGVVRKRPKPSLLSLIERERAEPEAKTRPPKRPAAAPRGTTANRSSGVKKPTGKPPKKKVVTRVRTVNRSKLKRFSLSRLKRSAFRDRGRAGRSVDVSKRIYKWSKSKPGRSFQD